MRRRPFGPGPRLRVLLGEAPSPVSVRIHLVAVEFGKDARNPVAFDVESAAGDEMRP